MLSLEALRADELRDFVPPGPDPYRHTLAALNSSDQERDVRAAWAAKNRAHGDITASALAEIRDEQGDRCAWCGTELDGGGHIDHVTPVALGGRSDRGNLVWSCRSCNLRKRAMSPQDWERERWLAMP